MRGAHRAGSQAHTYVHVLYKNGLWLLIIVKRSIWLVSQSNKDHLHSHTVLLFISNKLVQKSNSSFASRTYARLNGLQLQRVTGYFAKGFISLKRPR